MSDNILKPLVVFDIESTGLDIEKDHIIQFAAIKVNRLNGEIIDSINEYISPVGDYTISIQAYTKHHIKPDFLKDKPHFSEVSDKILNFFQGCDILSFNGLKFDIPFLKSEFKRIGQNIDFLKFDCYDAYIEEKRRFSHTLENTFKRYTGKSMEESGLTAHDAFSDIKATYIIFENQQKNQPYGPEKRLTEDNFIIEGEFNGKEQPIFNVGKYKGLPVSYISSIDQNYLRWCISDKASFVDSTKDYISKYIK